jgi:hypothetical protein
MVRTQSLACAFAVALSGVAGCSGAASAPKPAPMPANARWEGLYQGPYHIELRIQSRGNLANGSWRAIGGREGEFSGTVSGNLLVIDWSEHGLGNAEGWSGRGYFVYRTGERGGADEIAGEWGLGQSGTKSSWWAIKRPSESPGARLVDADSADDDPNTADTPSCGVGCDTTDTDTQE